jgi:glycosyltransferase 2 family protein
MSTAPTSMARLSSDTALREPPPASGLPLIRSIREHGRHLGAHRRTLWTLIWVAIAAAAIYFIVPEIGGLQESLYYLQAAHPTWLAVGAGLVVLRYVMTAVSLRVAVGRPLPFGPLFLVQLSSGFVGRLTPEGVGWVVLNQRYLERAGLARASALAAITLKVLAGIVARLAITVLIATLVGTSGVLHVSVPGAWPYLLAIALGAALVGLLLRRRIGPAAARAMEPVARGARDLVSVFRQPLRAASLFGASALLTLSYGLALAASVMAFGVEASLLPVLAVHLGATAVAAASPTPGNIGAVEVALTAGLTAIGVPPGPAVAAVLVYRLLTFWLPLVPGFIAFRYLQHGQHI